MKNFFLIFILSSVLIIAKENLKFKIQEKNNTNIKILIVKDEVKIPKKDENQMVNKKRYTVQAGDTLSLIAKKFNLSIDDLIKINNIKNKEVIIPNQKLIISK